MGQYTEPDGWVSYRDYIVHGVRNESGRKISLDEQLQMPPTPEGWVSEFDYHVNNVRKSAPTKRVDDFVVTLKAPPPKTPAPPEADFTVYEALDEVMSSIKSRELESRLEQMAREDLREFKAGLINQDELERRKVAASIILDNHARRKERIADWYLDHYFRLFENPESEEK
ncbi:MAG: hypothetical protein HQL67_03415 [Magnetococcales bacterium]|nr:hypothetical protein [Magnetococcales bacterium]